jgi:Spy/CpxP family protein refolding chaperone
MTLKALFGGIATALLLTVPAAAQQPAGPAATGSLDPAAGEVVDTQDPGPHGGGPMMRGPGRGEMMMHGHHGGMHRRRGMGRPLITMMLRHRDELGLTPAQVQSLEKLRSDYMRDAIRRDADRKIARLDLMALMRPDAGDPLKAVDMAQVETKVRELEKMRTDSQLARIRTIEAGKAQLTPEQRTKFAGLLAQMRGRWQRGDPQRPMGPQGPMMQPPPAPRS